MDDPPRVRVGRSVVKAARHKVDEEQRHGKIETLFGFFHNDGKQDGTDERRCQYCTVVDPTHSGPYVKVFGGEDPIDCYGRTEDNVIALNAEAQGEVVEGLQCDHLGEYKARIERWGVAPWFGLAGMCRGSFARGSRCL